MKKIFFFILLTASISACKRKQDPRTLDGTLAKYPSQCYNGNQDGSETGIDCGGTCGPCNVATPSCTPANNTMKVGTSTYTAAGTYCGVTGSQYEFSGNYSSGSTYSIKLGSNTPDVSVTYTITNSVPGISEATVDLNDPSLGGMSLSSGNVYVSLVGGVYNVTICGGSTYSWVTLTSYSVSGKVTCP